MVVFLPFPNRFNELFSAEVMSGLLVSPPKHVLDDALCGNTSVVTSREPERGLSMHSVPSYHEILERVSECVPHM